jgi:hypothetical protein
MIRNPSKNTLPSCAGLETFTKAINLNGVTVFGNPKRSLRHNMGRHRIYQNDAGRQAACRARKAEELARLTAERDEAVARAERAEKAVSRYLGGKARGSDSVSKV